MADPPGQARRALGGRGVGPDDPGRQLGPEADPAGPVAAGQLEQLGDDPRAALALVQLGEFEDRRPHRLVAGPREAVEQQRFQLGQPREVAGSQSRVPRTGVDRPLGDRAVAGRSRAHEPALLLERPPGPAATRGLQVGPGIAFSSCRVARSRRLNDLAWPRSSGPTITASLCPRVEP